MRNPNHISLVVLILLSMWFLPAEAKEEAPAPAADQLAPWEQIKLLEKHLALACDAAEAACEVTFKKRPSVHISDQATVARLMQIDLARMPENVSKKAQQETMAKAMASMTFAKYDTVGHGIHIVPSVFKALGSARKDDEAPLGLDHLRLFLVHEAVHALDFERFSLVEERLKRTSMDAHYALNAVVEGHAQFVTNAVAEQWTLLPAFGRINETIYGSTAIEEGLEKALVAAMLSTIRFAYGQGQDFFTAVHKARGIEGVTEALRNPPMRSKYIERPDEYLNPKATDGADLERVVKMLETVVSGPPWKTQSMRVLELQLKSQVGRLPKAHRANYLKGFSDARIVIGRIPSERAQVIAMTLEFDSKDNAKAFAAHDKLIAGGAELTTNGNHIKTLAFGEGAGTDNREHGMHMHRAGTFRGTPIALRQQVFVVGRVACEFMVVNAPEIERARIDALVDYVAAGIRDPESLATRTKPKVFPFKSDKRLVKVHVVDPDGNPVPKATLVIRRGGANENDYTMRLEKEYVDGGVDVEVPSDFRSISAYKARSAAGNPLNLGRSKLTKVSDNQTSIVLKMTNGLTIKGRVLDAQGKPAPRLKIDVRPDLSFAPHSAKLPILTSTETALDGTFEVVGLQESTYTITVSWGRDANAAKRTFTNIWAGKKDVELALHSAVSATVTVLGPDGEPVAGATVRAVGTQSIHSFPNDFPLSRSITDQQGKITLPGLNDNSSYKLTVNAEDVNSRRPLRTWSLDVWKPENTVVRLEWGWNLMGVVLDSNGKPIRGRVYRKHESGWSSLNTELDGTFKLKGLPLHGVNLAATSVDIPVRRLSGHEFQWDMVLPSYERIKLETQLVKPAPKLTIRVVDSTGSPISKASIYLAPVQSNDWRGYEMKNGVLTCTIQESNYIIHIYNCRSADGKPLAVAPEVSIHSPTRDREVKVPLAPARPFRGTVKTPKGQGIAGVRVVAFAALDGKDFDKSQLTHQEVTTSSDGRFEFSSLGHLPYKIQVIPPPPFAQLDCVDVAADASTINVVATKGTALKVIDYRGNEVKNAYVRLSRRATSADGNVLHRNVLRQDTDEKGNVYIRPLSADDSFLVEISAPDSRDDLFGYKSETWKPTSRSITLARGYTITGTVTNHNGPVRGAAVYVDKVDSPHERPERYSDSVTTDSLGRYKLFPVPLGRVEVSAEDPRNDLGRGKAIAATPDNADVALVVPNRTVTLRLVLAEAPGGATGILKRNKERRKEFELGMRGTHVFAQIDPGTYTVLVRDPENKNRVAHGKIDLLDSSTLRLSFVDCPPIRFNVNIPEGVEATATITGPAGLSRTIEVAEKNVVEGFPPGRWPINVSGIDKTRYWKGAALSSEDDVVPTITLRQAGVVDTEQVHEVEVR